MEVQAHTHTSRKKRTHYFREFFFPFLTLILYSQTPVSAQVQVSKEPRHNPVLENNYIRLLDVWLPPGDTTLFHIHSTPSLFMYLNKAKIGSQVKGQDWVHDQSETGFVWYNPFFPDTLIHRVCNADTLTFHVNDIEILAPFAKSKPEQLKALDLHFLIDNEKAFAYQLNNSDIGKQTISGRGPMVAVLAVGEAVNFHNTKTNQAREIKTGGYLYIEPGSSFYFSSKETGEIKMVLFEIK